MANNSVTSDIKICLWNATSINNKDIEFSYFLHSNNIDIAIVTETWLNPNTKLYFSNYNIIRLDSPRVIAGGVAIIIKNSIKFNTFPSPKLSIGEVLLVNINAGVNLIIGAIYIPPSITFDVNSLDSIFRGSRTPIILGGDFNAKHTHWNNFYNNARGAKLFHYINNSNISIIHSDTFTYKQPSRRNSNLDFFLVKDIPYLNNCYSLDELSSNHIPVILELENVNVVRRDKVSFKTDWSKFSSSTSCWKINHKFHSISDIDECIDELCTFLHRTFKNSTTRYNTNFNHFNSDYDSLSTLDGLIKMRNYFRRKYQRTSRFKYKKFKNILSGMINDKLTFIKNENWNVKLQSLKTQDNSLWRILKSCKRKKFIAPPFVLDDDSVIYNNKDKAQALAENFKSVHQQSYNLASPFESEVDNFISSLDTLSPSYDASFLSPKLIFSIIRKFPNGKAPGLDRVTTQMLKKSSWKISVQIYYIILFSFSFFYFPTQWKKAKVLAFPKPGKNPSSPANFRPISLLSVFSKIFEMVILLQINLHLHDNNIIINEQFGFRKQHSTVLQLLRVSEHIAFEINKNRSTGMVLLDLKKAFDSVWQHGLLFKLNNINLPIALIKILRSYFMNRSCTVDFCGEISDPFYTITGVPQGSILGPVLFNIFINDMPKLSNTHLAVYADDTALYTSSWSPVLLKTRLQVHIDAILQYFSDWKLAINADKTEAIVFTHKRLTMPPPVKVLDYRVPWSKQVKYLGIFLDSRLNWRSTVYDRIRKSFAALKFLYPFINFKSRLPTNLKLLLYKTCVRSILLYAAPVWAAVALSHLRRLQCVQNKFLRIIYNKHRTVEIHNLANIEYIDSIIARLLANAYDFNHENPLVCNIGNYDISLIPFKIRCRLPKHFSPFTPQVPND